MAFVVLVVVVSVVVSCAGVVDDAWRCMTCLLEFSFSAIDKIIPPTTTEKNYRHKSTKSYLGHISFIFNAVVLLWFL